MPRYSERARLAALRRYRPADDPEVLAAAENLRAARADDYIRELVESWPPLSDETRRTLAAILAPASNQEAA